VNFTNDSANLRDGASAESQQSDRSGSPDPRLVQKVISVPTFTTPTRNIGCCCR
jgi:hypothetical protein